MKKYISILVILMVLSPSITLAGYTRGYVKSNGTYVAPTYKTIPNKIKFDNYSAKGNYNPYSGKKGYKKWY